MVTRYSTSRRGHDRLERLRVVGRDLRLPLNLRQVMATCKSSETLQTILQGGRKRRMHI